LSFLSSLYPWTKAIHVMAVITWMAGLFYLPRLFVYHAEQAAPGSEMSETFKLMEARLQEQIMRPAMAATWFFGILLLLTPGVISWKSDFWIYIKLAAVLVLTWFHHWLIRRRKDFAADRNHISGRTYRMMNELPTVALVIIVVMVIVRPF
jgi:putative membrane protein